MNMNSVCHPTITYGALRDWDYKTGFPELLKYYEGVDDFTADMLTKVSNEVLAIRDALARECP